MKFRSPPLIAWMVVALAVALPALGAAGEQPAPAGLTASQVAEDDPSITRRAPPPEAVLGRVENRLDARWTSKLHGTPLYLLAAATGVMAGLAATPGWHRRPAPAPASLRALGSVLTRRGPPAAAPTPV